MSAPARWLHAVAGLTRGFLLAVALPLSVGCTSAPVVEQSPDWGGYATWDWLQQGPPAVQSVTTPIGVARTEHSLRELIQRGLSSRGFRRDRRNPELRIGLLLNLETQSVEVLETGALHTVPSMNHTPNVGVQVTASRTEWVDHSRLFVFAIDTSRAQVVWRGTLRSSSRESPEIALAEAVATLLSRFPPPSGP